MVSGLIFAAVLSAESALWIEPRTGSWADADVGIFRRSVVNRGEVRKAVWTVAALGAWSASVNGKNLPGYMNGGFSQPEKTRYSQTFDVTGDFRRGAGATNVISAAVSASWWRDSIMRRDLVKKGAGYPRASALNAVLRLEYADGSAEEIVTDTEWDAVYGGQVVRAGVFEGETQDLMRDGEHAGEFDCERWEKAVVNRDFSGEIRPLPGPAITLREDLAMKCRESLPMTLEPGREYVFDFGQNSSAIERMTVEGRYLSTLTVRHAEMLNEPDGDPKRGNIGPGGSLYTANLRGIPAATVYRLRNGSQFLQPRFTFFGYRYVGITVTAPVKLVSLESVPVTSIHAENETATFECGDGAVNQLVSNVRWGFRSNYLSVPTDCPQRNERLGWTADTMVFTPAAVYLADVRGFLGKWLGDLVDGQSDEGAYEQLAPLVWSSSKKNSTAGWSDAGVMVPYRLWRHFGDLSTARKNYASMKRCMDYLRAHGGHDRCCYGDWCAFELGNGNWTYHNAEQSQEYCDTFGLFHWIEDAMAMREMATALGFTADAETFAADEQRARTLFRERYMGEDGMIRKELRGQTSSLYMLKFGLCRDEAARTATKQVLLDSIKAHGDCLQTGFLGTAIIMNGLTDLGEIDLAYTLLLQHRFPSWLYSVDQGATTIWEKWDCYTKEKGFGLADMNSFNHYSYGSVFSWMMSTAAGIRPNAAEGGFRRFRLEPHPDRRLGYVKASYRAPEGLIASSWRYEGDRVVYEFIVPEGTTAELLLPGETKTRTLAPGRWPIR